MPEWRMAEPVDFCLNEKEHIAIVGDNAAGKTMLVDIITGSHPLLMKDVAYDFSPKSSKLASDNINSVIAMVETVTVTTIFSKDGINMISTRALLQWRACSMMLTK